MKLSRLSLIAALGLVLAGCSQAPTADIDAAKAALEDARQAQAAEYAPQAWTAAQDADAKLQVELDAQQKRWAPLRSYTVAKQLAADTKAAADRSRAEAVTGMETAKNEVTTMMVQARDEAAKAKAAVEAAPRGKGTEADLASLKTDATSIDDTLAEMQRAFDAGNYIEAKTKAQAALDASKRILDEVEMAKTGRRAA